MATTNTTESPVTTDAGKNLRNFRNSADIENFYRFVFENKLRREAHMILKSIWTSTGAVRRKRKRSKKLQ